VCVCTCYRKQQQQQKVTGTLYYQLPGTRLVQGTSYQANQEPQQPQQPHLGTHF
jgi:hypothetical protein